MSPPTWKTIVTSLRRAASTPEAKPIRILPDAGSLIRKNTWEGEPSRVTWSEQVTRPGGSNSRGSDNEARPLSWWARFAF